MGSILTQVRVFSLSLCGTSSKVRLFPGSGWSRHKHIAARQIFLNCFSRTYTKHGPLVHGPLNGPLNGPGPWTSPVDHPSFSKLSTFYKQKSLQTKEKNDPRTNLLQYYGMLQYFYRPGAHVRSIYFWTTFSAKDKDNSG